MVIGLVFLAYFMFEIVSGARAHPAQYIMVGLAQAIFYLLLLAFAERLGLYAGVPDRSGRDSVPDLALRECGFQKAALCDPGVPNVRLVYALTYVLMQMEDYSLLVGSLACFGALAALMYLTRNVAWYGAADARDEGAKP